jgi:hypothetical protein
MCACGRPEREGIDHTTHVCITAGFFGPEDFAAIDAAANPERNTDAQARHRR